MEKTETTITLNRAAVARYFTLIGLGFCLLFVTLLGAGLIAAIVYAFFIAPRLSPRQAAALKYRFDDKTLRVDLGVYFLSRKAIPLDRITDLALVQGPLMRYVGIWALRVQTAGTGTPVAEAILYGIDNAEEVRESILSARDAYIASRKAGT